jgi:uncharacterized membrane protein YbhN (UPF0104 family)
LKPYFENFAVRLSGEAARNLTFTGPLVGEPLKAWLLRRTGLPAAAAVAAVITEHLVYTFASAAIGLAGLSYILRNMRLGKDISLAARIITCAMGAFLLVSALAIIFWIYVIGAVVVGMRRLPLVGKRVPWDPAGVRRMEDLLFEVFRAHPQRLEKPGEQTDTGRSIWFPQAP